MPDAATILIHIFCLVDDFCKTCEVNTPHKGAPYKLSDSELITLILIQALFGIESERSFIRFMNRFFEGWFPLLDQSQYNRRIKSVKKKLEMLRIEVLSKLDIQTDMFIIDSMPVPVMNPVRVRFSGSFPEMQFGHCASLKQNYYGGKFHVLITPHGIPIKFELTDSLVDDRDMLKELLQDCGFITVIGDKGYISEEIANTMYRDQKIFLIVPNRSNQKKTISEAARMIYKKCRKMVETVFNQFADHLSFKRCLAKTLNGLTTRILQKMTAFTVGIYLNKLLGRKRLAIKSLLA